MATYNGNNVFLSIGGTNVSAYYTNEISYSESNALQEITAGAGETFMERGKGLGDITLDVELVYDDANVANYVDKLEPGEAFTVIYGPEGNTAGMPKLEAVMRVASTSHAVNIARNMVRFQISFQLSGTVTSRIHNGDTF